MTRLRTGCAVLLAGALVGAPAVVSTQLPGLETGEFPGADLWRQYHEQRER